MVNLPDSCIRVFNHCTHRSHPAASGKIAWCARLPFSSFEPLLSSPRNKVRITREHASPRRSLPVFSFFFSITPHLPGKIMPVHISPALSARQVALDPHRLRFLSHATRERRGKGESEPLPRKPASRRVLRWHRYLNWNGLFQRDGPISSPIDPRNPLLPPLSRPLLFVDISTRLPFISSSWHKTLTRWQTDAHIHMPTNDKNTYRTPQNYFFFFFIEILR